jgi:hypothetical protein
MIELLLGFTLFPSWPPNLNFRISVRWVHEVEALGSQEFRRDRIAGYWVQRL